MHILITKITIKVTTIVINSLVKLEQSYTIGFLGLSWSRLSSLNVTTILSWSKEPNHTFTLHAITIDF